MFARLHHRPVKTNAMKSKYLVISFLIILISCNRTTYETIYPTLSDGRYDSEFPYRSSSTQLELISKSVKKIFCMTDYRTYKLPPEDKLLPKDLREIPREDLLKLCIGIINTFDSKTGSATIISNDEKSIVLLTCAHIVDALDTIYTYYDDNDPDTQDFLYSIGIKFKQRILFTGFEEGQDLEILAIDKNRDLVLIGKHTNHYNPEINAFPYPLGISESLEWGTFVYLMGYPLGYNMITRGIVSPGRDDYFLIDASFNEGFSGGIVLAIKDGIPNFEVVGIGKSASATFENILVPEKESHEVVYNPDVPYTEDVYVRNRKMVNYGITKAISTSAIREFYKENREGLEGKGYYLVGFFGE